MAISSVVGSPGNSMSRAPGRISRSGPMSGSSAFTMNEWSNVSSMSLRHWRFIVANSATISTLAKCSLRSALTFSVANHV